MDNPVAALSEYDLRHLAAHLEESGRADELHRLLALETSERRNAWYEAREVRGESSGFLSDIARAWRLADESYFQYQSPTATGLQCRYALTVASINSLEKNMPPELLEALRITGRWTTSQALAAMQQNPDIRTQAEMLAALAPQLPEDERLVELRQMLDRSRVLQADMYRYAEVLAVLAPQLPESGRLAELRRALDSIRIQSEYQQLLAIAALAPALPVALLREALIAIQSLTKQRGMLEWEKALRTLTRYLIEQGDLQGALEAADTIEDKTYLAYVLKILAPHLPEALLYQELYKGFALDGWSQAQILAVLAPYLPESERRAVLRQALDAARTIRDDQARASMLAKLVPLMSGEEQLAVQRESLRVARTVEQWHGDSEKAAQVRLLASLAPYHPDPLLQEALRSAQVIDNPWKRIAALVELIPYLPPQERQPVLQEAIDIARAQRSSNIWYEGEVDLIPGLIKLIPSLTEPLQREMLAFIQEHKEISLLEALIPRLSEPLLGEALAAARTSTDARGAAKALTMLALHLPEQEQLAVLEEALSMTRAIGDNNERAKALAALALHMTAEDQLPLLHVVLNMARVLEDSGERAKLLDALTPMALHLFERDRLPMLHDILDVTRKIGDAYWRAWTLTRLVHQLPRPEQSAVLQEVLTSLRDVTDNVVGKARVLLATGPLVPKKKLMPALRKALKGISRMLTDDQAMLLPEFAPHLPPALLRQALDAVWALGVPDRGSMLEAPMGEVLGALVPHLPAALLPEALDRARDLEDEPSRDEALALLAPRLAEVGNYLEALSVSKAIEDEYWRALSLAKLISHLPQQDRLAAQREVLVQVRTLQSEWRQSRVLAALAPDLSPTLLNEALEAAQELEEVEPRIVALAPLLPLVSQEKRPAVLRGTWEAIRERRQLQELIALAPLLPPELLLEALDVIRKDEYYLQQTPKVLAQPLAQLPPATLHPYLREVLHVLARRPRGDLLGDLVELAPILAVLGGTQAVTMISNSIQDVGSWWP
jgi:hypothetical protein